jgi:predicted ATPase
LHTLPVQLASFVGRERELRSLRGLLQRRDVRLVTLTGPGGSGKSRLSIEAASGVRDLFEGGIVFVPLAPVTGADGVAGAIARALDAPVPDDPLSVTGVVEIITGRQLLLLLDNFEHVLAAAPLILELLHGCPRLKILVTSRATLRLSGEQEFPVAPLALPDVEHVPPADDLTTNPSVVLFVDRASRVRPDFVLTDDNAADVARLCARLDGLPLAIELAAARLKVLSPVALLDRMSRGPVGERLRLLSGGARDLPARQRTMHETMTWSYNLLNADEQRLLRRLAVFSGGCTLDAAATICADEQAASGPAREARTLDGLASLVDNSLVYQSEGPDGESRFMMLETIREFAMEQLIADGEASELRRRHAGFYLALVEGIGALLFATEHERARVAPEYDNIQAALHWLVQQG